MKNLLIIGAGGFGREVYWIARGIRDQRIDWEIKGFLDDRADILDKYTYEHPIISSVEDYQPEPDDLFICGIGVPDKRKYYCEKILAKGGVFTNLIHPSVAISPNIQWGVGIVICSYASISCDSSIGNFVSINSYSLIGHDVEIGDYTHINSYAFIGGSTKIGQEVTIHPHAVIKPEGQIDDNAVVGAGSVVLSKIKRQQTVFGVPALPVKY